MADSSGSRTFSVPLGWTLPSLGRRVIPAGGRVDVSTTAESIVAYDTADADLAAVGVALQRATSVEASHWRLRIGADTSTFPAPDAASRGVPAEIRDLLLAARAGAALRVVGRTERTGAVHHVIDADDAELGTVTLVHDSTATPSAEGAELDERQSVIVAGWQGPFVAAVTKRLTKAGASEPETAPAPEHATVGAALDAYLREQHRAMASADLDLRLGVDAVHRFRVAIRRMRSAVRVVDVTAADQATRLDTELKWLSEVLGAVRDRQVLREHLMPDGLDVPAALESAYAHIDRVLSAEHEAARVRLTTVLAGRRYTALLRTLRAWRTTPPFTGDADKPVARLSRYTRDATRKLDKRLARAQGSAEKLHQARKAAKRARYVADLAGPHGGKHGPQLARHARTLQTRLGDYQDSVVAAEFLRRAARSAPVEAAFGCGVLWEREQQRAAAAAAAAE